MDIRDDTAALEYLKKKNIELLTKRDGEVVSGRVGASLLMELLLIPICRGRRSG